MKRTRFLTVLLAGMVLLSCVYSNDPGYGKCEDLVGALSDRLGTVGQGGIIFYDKGYFSDGWQYLEVIHENFEFSAHWSDTFDDIPGTKIEIGSGKKNTDIIADSLTSLGQVGTAAQLCKELNVNGYNDWFLPSMDELTAMMINLHMRGLGGFGKSTNRGWYYWSSSQLNSASFAWYRYFDYNDWFRAYYPFLWGIKDSSYRVRAIRAF